MWLDRFSTPSGTPPPQGRPYSPAPRRPYNPAGPGPLPQRPGLPDRTSSLSLVSPNSSTTSLPAGARGPNGAGRRRQPPPNVSDPLQVLEGILGAPPRRPVLSKGNGSASVPPQKPAELVDDIDFGGLSLHEFAQETTAQELAPVHTYSAQSVEEYDKEKDKFEDLHRSILACDEVLKSVEMYLTNFQSDLGAVSAEIETLQSRSTALNTKLENRKVVEKLLGPAVEDISISPAVVKKISDGPIDDGFLRALNELEKRSKSINTKAKENTSIKALEDVKPMLDDLTNKAVERIRDYIVAQIKAIRSPSINAQIIQQQAFIKYRDLFTFLAKHQPQLAEEIGKAYVFTMRWYYLNHFSRYQKALEKLKIHALDEYDVLGQEKTVKRGALLGNARGAPAAYDAFSIGRRIDLLKNPSHSALTAYVAEEEKATHYLEVPFQAFNLALIDNASFEYTFLTTYFGPVQNYHSISRTFMSIFEPTFALGQALTKQLIETTTDGLGILLCVRLNQHFAFEMQRRKVPTVEGYINATNMLLWPRFQLVIDQHCESLRRLTASLPNRAASSASILTSSSTSQSTAPHPMTQKFANLLQSILSLSSEAGDDEPVSNSLGRLRSDFEAYLTRLSKGISEQRKRERFLCNNYSLVYTILADTDGRLAEETKEHFETLRDTFDN
ncbi:Vps52-domain-containing protein [Mytilinidion resinicola]|uniref:Vps52-domain-containing protein n=1 Tax=Mytilinidion resinicola TaxID=574789 RepID=A0A6A6Y292_9PEZI|nr:Vps52-domain-containing protein [Mytilinidion resinicola]KAF2802931.1 Vps52-domain-containing protein [Mytilinidion resinicola]